MEYRKLIKFGKSSYIVSLPRKWVEQHNLKKGDPLHLDMSGTGELMLTPKLKEVAQETKGITIDANNKDIFHLKREVIAAYIKNYKNIVITGDNLVEKALGIRDIFNELVALESMEQTVTRISAKDFLDMNNISLHNIIRKIDMLIRSALFDVKTLAKERKKSSMVAYPRDKDINRLVILALRTVRYGINNPSFIAKNKLQAHELLQYYTVAINLEKVGDEVKRIAKMLDHFIDDHLNSKEEKEFYNTIVDFFVEIEHIYLNALKAFYKQDTTLAFDLANKRALLMKRLEDFSSSVAKKRKRSDRVVQKLSSMLNFVHAITRLAYQG